MKRKCETEWYDTMALFLIKILLLTPVKNFDFLEKKY